MTTNAARKTEDQTKTASTTPPRVYLACLASYNAGELHGAWADATDEDEGLADVAAKGAFIAEHGELGAELLAHFSGRLDEAEGAFVEYAGEWPDLAHFAEDLTEQSGALIPDSIRLHVDYDGMGRDMEFGGDMFTVRTSTGAVHVF